MNKIIIDFTIGTDMGTKETNQNKYLKLWDAFDKILKKEGLNLSSFSKKWEEGHDSSEQNDYKIFYDKIKKQKSRRNKIRRVSVDLLIQLEEYIKFLDDDFAPFTALSDEKFGNLFN